MSSMKKLELEKWDTFDLKTFFVPKKVESIPRHARPETSPNFFVSTGSPDFCILQLRIFNLNLGD